MDVGKSDQQVPSTQNFVPGDLTLEKQTSIKPRALPQIGDTVISQTTESVITDKVVAPPQNSPQLLEPGSEAVKTPFPDQVLDLKEALQLPNLIDLANNSGIEKILNAIFGQGFASNRTSKGNMTQAAEETELQNIDLPPQTEELVQESSLPTEFAAKENITKFFDFLSNSYPIGLAIHTSLMGNPEKTQNLEFLKAPQEVIEQLSQEEQMQSVEFTINPETNEQIKQALSGFEAAPPAEKQQILQFIGNQKINIGILANTIALSQAFSQDFPESMNSRLALFSFFQSFSSKTSLNSIGDFIQNNVDALAIHPESKGEIFYTHAFKYATFAGTLLGIALTFMEKKEDNSKAGLLFSAKLQTIQKLKLLDLIPFSFLAFFPDIRQKKEEDPDVIKSAKNALLELIRILLQLVFVLSALAAAKQKLGSKEMSEILGRHSLYLFSLFDRLIFALKKVDELYVIDVSFHLKKAELAKGSLIAKDENAFWQSAVSLFSTKTELSCFLEETEEAEILFKTIKTLLSGPEKLSLGSQEILS